MALSRAAGLSRLALRTQFAAARLLSVGVGGARAEGDDRRRLGNLTAPQRERAPPAERSAPRNEFGSPKPTYEQVQLNKAIKDSVSVDEVLDLVGASLAVMNPVNVATALTTIAKRHGERETAAWLKSDARFRRLMRTARSVMECKAVEAQAFANMLYACGQLGIVAPPSWLRVYWDASASKLGDFKSQELSNTLYGCSQLGIMPPADWLQSFWNVSASKLGEFKPQELSNTLYAGQQLGITPPADWLLRFWHACIPKLDDYKPQELSNTLYACGELGIVPRADWLQRYWDASALKLGLFKPQELSNALYACSQLGVRPPADWLQRYWDASALKLGEFKPQELSNTLYASSQLGVTPPADWLLRFWHASALRFAAFNPQELSNTLYGCSQLGITPPADWLLRFWHASALKLPDFKPQALSNTLYACSQLGITPPAYWLATFSREYKRSLPDMNQQDLANTSFALATLALWELPLWPGLWERLCCFLSRDIAGWSAGDRLQAMQLYQAYTAAAVERPGVLPAPSLELLAAAHKSWIDRVRYGIHNETSKLHGDVSACLTKMGIAHVNERWCERTERGIDIAIEGVTRVAVEVDGPTHFLQDGRRDGSTLLRNRMLAAHGWRVVVVDYRVWQHQLTTEAQREQYLRRLLA